MPQRDNDNFTYSNGNLASVSSAKWSKLSAYTDLTVSTNRLLGVAGTECPVEITSWSGDTASHYSQCVITSNGALQYCGPTICSNGSDSFYLFDARDSSSAIYKVTAGPTYDILASDLGGTHHLVSGDTIYMERVGGVISAKINGVTAVTVTDTSLATGKPGLRCYGDASFLDTWVAGDFQDSAALTNVNGAGALGTAVLAVVVALSGIAATGATGTVAPARSVASTSVIATGATGSVAPARTLAFTGEAGAGSVGTQSGTDVVASTGVGGTGTTGTLVASSGGGAALSNVAATTSLGTTTPVAAVSLTNTNASGATGTLTAQTSSTDAALTGAGATGALGVLAQTHGGTLALTSASATGVVGTMTTINLFPADIADADTSVTVGEFVYAQDFTEVYRRTVLTELRRTVTFEGDD